MTQGSTLKVPALLVAWLVVSSALAADPQGSAPGSQSPIPRIIPHGPATLVQAIAFANGGQTLYAGGWDKVVCRWDLVGNQWELVEDGFLTIPIGGGLDGAIQALVVSPDG
ncbi:MAG: hypothetical protein KDA66_19435, partial [Planctomycetaceae bacterium]|nr:hypothetical protein [Planctomycetaceae bacterium]